MSRCRSVIKHEENPFNTYRIKTVKTDREELSLEEVQRIVHLGPSVRISIATLAVVEA